MAEEPQEQQETPAEVPKPDLDKNDCEQLLKLIGDIQTVVAAKKPNTNILHKIGDLKLYVESYLKELVYRDYMKNR